MVHTEIYWSGNGALSNIHFLKDNFFEYKESKLETKISELWNDHKKEFPQDYDGKLLFLNDIEFEEELDSCNNHFFLQVSWIRYSTLIGLTKLEIPMKKYGILGNQVAIFDESEKFILVGKRKTNQRYAPGLLTLPGGMFEVDDIKLGPSSFLRELHEEVHINIKKTKFIALLSEHTTNSSIFLIKGILSQEFNPHEIFVDQDNEFEEKQLFWLHVNQLKKLHPSTLMEGLTYLQTIL